MQQIPLLQLFFALLILSSCARGASSSAGTYNASAQEAKNLQLVRTYWEEVWNKGNLQGVEAFYHPQARHGENFSIAGFQKGVASQRAAFPDFHVRLDDIFAVGDRVICRVTYLGTHSGRKMFGQEPLNKAIEVPGMDIFTLKDGQCVEHQHVADHLDLVLQMGLKLTPAKDLTIVEQQVLQAAADYLALVKRLYAGKPADSLVQANNIAAFDRVLAEDYLATSPEGTVYTKADDLAFIQSSGVVLIAADVMEQKVLVLNESTAVETGILHYTGSNKGKAFDYSKRYTTTWSYRDGRWQIVADHSSRTNSVQTRK